MKLLIGYMNLSDNGKEFSFGKTHISDDLISFCSGHSRDQDVLKHLVEMWNVLLHNAKVIQRGLARWNSWGFLKVNILKQV